MIRKGRAGDVPSRISSPFVVRQEPTEVQRVPFPEKRAGKLGPAGGGGGRKDVLRVSFCG